MGDGGHAGKDGKGAAADFMSGLLKSLPPLHDVAAMAGLEMPAYLGKMKDPSEAAACDGEKSAGAESEKADA